MPSITLLYHYFHPDDVVSARHFAGLAEGLVKRGWDVEARPCNRGCRDDRRTYPLRETWHGVRVRRVWRPRFKQASGIGRLLNALWMVAAWSGIALRWRPPDVLLMGTDPVLSVLVAGVVKTLRPRVRVAHLVYDLHPEAGVADGLLRPDALSVRVLRRLLGWAYRKCDLIVDIGPCMRDRLEVYRPQRRRATLVPWALAEPTAVPSANPATRRRLFGDAKLALLYSGNFGRAHDYELFLALARRLRGSGVHFCFAARGNRADELRQAVTADDTNISFGGFVLESELEDQLASADVHLASLRPGWTGLVVPSKFFGSLATGRPVLFAGEPDAAIGQWIRQYGIGWVLTPQTADDVAADLRRLADDPAALPGLQRRCWEVYRTQFAYEPTLDAWDRELRALVSPKSQ
jgi:colanic acid biosynthesis glycosyl transferase WcaI